MLSVINIFRELFISYFKTENNISEILPWKKIFKILFSKWDMIM